MGLHGFDAFTPIEETLGTLSNLARSDKIRYIGCSNFAGWHLMKSLGISEKYGLPRYAAHQAYYSLIGRDYEWEPEYIAKLDSASARTPAYPYWPYYIQEGFAERKPLPHRLTQNQNG